MRWGNTELELSPADLLSLEVVGNQVLVALASVLG